jgi:hypothetical protein
VIACIYVVVRHLRRLRREIWVYLAMLLSYWALISVVVDPSPGLSRYLYPGSMFLLLFLGELAHGARAGLRGFLALAAIAAVALFSNITTLNQAGDFFRVQAEASRGELGVIDAVGGRLPAGYLIRPASPIMPLHVGEYLDAADSYGTPAYPTHELAEAPLVASGAADTLLVRALRLRLSPSGRAPSPGQANSTGPEPAQDVVGRARPCLRVDPRFPIVTVARSAGPSTLYLKAAPGARVELIASRFLPAPAVPVGFIDAGQAAVLRLPRDPIALPWRFQATAGQLAFACLLP